MKAFEIINLYHCQLTGMSLLCFKMSVKGDANYYERSFNDLEIAKQYAQSTKKTWLLSCMENYILHKKQIWGNTPNAEAQNNCRICFDTYVSFEGQSLEKICKRILTGQKYFEAILPSPNNDSHLSSKQNLTEILNFCIKETAK